MCGITGIDWQDKKLIQQMTDAIAHRGPDASKTYAKDVSLGHRRLAIIDLSKDGIQPMKHLHYIIVFNGEIYNYKEIKRQLPEYTFKTKTDTEVILYAYDKFKEKALEKLNGMFAFCIYNTKTKQFFLARDRFGIKPLYYTQTKKGFAFASEIKALLKIKNTKDISKEGLSEYFRYRFTLDQNTAYKNINKFLPGHFMLYDTKSRSVLAYKKYYELKSKPITPSFAHAKKNIRRLLEQSVQRRMIADVPVATLLSGGLDSTIITFLAKKHNPKLNTFSIGFDTTNELSYANLVAKRLKTNHREFKITAKDALKHLRDIVYHMDEPIADPGFLPIYILSKHVSKYNKVVLSGDGADEIFLGYDRYKLFYYGSMLKHLAFFKSKHPIIKQLHMMRNKSKQEIFANLSGIFTLQELKQMQIPLPKKTQFANKPLLTSASLYDIKYLLPNYFFMKADKMSSAFGLEQRVPFMDHELVNYVINLPNSYKLHFWDEKYILKQAFPDIPKEVLQRRKHGFNVPIVHWFKNELGEHLQKIVKKNKHNLYNKNIISTLLDQIKKTDTQERINFLLGIKLWGLLIFEMWYEVQNNA